jgi:hypothetical protein
LLTLSLLTVYLWVHVLFLKIQLDCLMLHLSSSHLPLLWWLYRQVGIKYNKSQLTDKF